MKPRKYILLCCIVVCTIFLAAIWFLSKESFDSVPIIEGEDKSEFILHQTEQVPREDVTSFIADNGKIYIFYDETALINVYDTDGSFEYGIQLSTIQNSHGDIAVLDGKLFVKSRRSIIFIFREGQMIDSIDPYSSYEKYISTREIFSGEKHTVDGGCNYELSEASNDIIRSDTQETVIDLPQKSYIAEHLLIAGLLVLFLSIYGFDKLFRN